MSGAEMRDSEEVKNVRLTESASAHSCPGHAPAPYLVYVGLGANLGDRRASLRRALRLLAHVEDTRLLRVSSFYETPPWGNEKQPPFLNACAALETRLSAPHAAHRACARPRAQGALGAAHDRHRPAVCRRARERAAGASPAASVSSRTSLRPSASGRDCAWADRPRSGN